MEWPVYLIFKALHSTISQCAMRSLCATEATLWQPIPDQNTLVGIPFTFYRDVIAYVLESEVAPLLQDHCCDRSAPCAVLRKAIQLCVPHLLVCKQWKAFVSTILERPQYSKLETPEISEDGSCPSYEIARDYSLIGRYRAHTVIESGEGESIVRSCGGSCEVTFSVFQIKAYSKHTIMVFRKDAMVELR